MRRSAARGRGEIVRRVDVAERVGLVVEGDLDDGSVAYQRSILRPPPSRKAADAEQLRRARQNTGCA
jgi:hypothetical protein